MVPQEQPPRFARLVLVGPNGDPVGALPLIPVASPWWNDIEPLANAVEERYGARPTVLRLLSTAGDGPAGGEVTYLAELSATGLPLEPWSGELDEHPLRLPWARPGGPAADLDWATTVLAAQGLEPSAAPVQVRTWNLSSVWRIPLGTQNAWLKAAPPFFGHEGAIIDALSGGPVPRAYAHEFGRVLLTEIPGEDQYDAQLPALLEFVSALVSIQAEWTLRGDELLALGLPDWRGPALTEAIASVFERNRVSLDRHDATVLEEFVHELPELFARLDECGMPDGLVHGDFGPNNVRGSAGAFTILDWGDSGVGHPLLDQSAFLERAAKPDVAPVREHWEREWLERLPESQPRLAAELVTPIAAARQAVIYQCFLDNIEPAEQVYHRDDPVSWLKETAGILTRA